MNYERNNKLFDLTLLDAKIRTKFKYLIDLPDFLFKEVKNIKIPINYQLFGYNLFKGVDDVDLVNSSIDWLKVLLQEIQSRYPNDNYTFQVMLQTKMYSLDVEAITNASKTKTLPSFTSMNQEEAIEEMFYEMFRLIRDYQMSDCNMFELSLIGKRLSPGLDIQKQNLQLHWPYTIFFSHLKEFAKTGNRVIAKLTGEILIKVEYNTNSQEYLVELYKLLHVDLTLKTLQIVPVKFDQWVNLSEYKSCGKFIEKTIDNQLLRTSSIYTYIVEEDNEKQVMKLKQFIYPYKKLHLLNLSKPVFEDHLNNVSYATLDFETFLHNQGKEDKIFLPYALGIYINETHNKVFHLSDFMGEGLSDEAFVNMTKSALDYLVQHKIKRVYAHNSGQFDNYILLRLVSLLKSKGVVIRSQVIIKKDTIRKLSITYKNVTINIKDSYLLIPQSLEALCKSYGLPTKQKFPHKYMTLQTLTYVGPKPNKEYYKGVNDQDYNDIPTTVNLKEQVTEYVLWDCKSLHLIITRFREDVFKSFKIDSWNNETISGLAYDIWLNTTDKLAEIESLPNDLELCTNIRKSYFGGISEIVEPTIGIDKNYQAVKTSTVKARYYDVNSLYPYIMKSCEMPIGGIEYTLNIDIKEFFGFCKVKVEAPNDSILLLPKWTKMGLLTPSGTWEGWYFSEELKKAVSIGYKITPLEGYRFNRKAKIFNDFVEPLFKLKQTTDPAQRGIAKLLLNSLYGMFGYTSTADLILNVISNEEYLNSESLSAKYKEGSGDSIKISHGSRATNAFNTNVAIASAICSYARIFMYDYRKNALYHDTDSIVVTQPLPETIVDNTELGKFKLEHEITYGVFLTNKTYGLYTNDNNIKMATAGFDSSLLTLSEIIKNLYSTPITKTHEIFLKDPTRLLIIKRDLDKELSQQYISRLKVYIQYVENKEVKKYWVGTLPWRFNYNCIELPSRLLDIYKNDPIVQNWIKTFKEVNQLDSSFNYELIINQEDEKKIVELNVNKNDSKSKTEE